MHRRCVLCQGRGPHALPSVHCHLPHYDGAQRLRHPQRCGLDRGARTSDRDSWVPLTGHRQHSHASYWAREEIAMSIVDPSILTPTLSQRDSSASGTRLGACQAQGGQARHHRGANARSGHIVKNLSAGEAGPRQLSHMSARGWPVVGCQFTRGDHEQDQFP